MLERQERRMEYSLGTSKKSCTPASKLRLSLFRFDDAKTSRKSAYRDATFARPRETQISVLIPRQMSDAYRQQSRSMLPMLLLQVTAAAVGLIQRQTDN
jgi:hypothetical protein